MPNISKEQFPRSEVKIVHGCEEIELHGGLTIQPQVWNTRLERYLKVHSGPNNTPMVNLRRNGINTTISLGRLVMSVHRGIIPNTKVIHRDRNPHNNLVDNLKNSIQDASVQNPDPKLAESVVSDINYLQKRYKMTIKKIVDIYLLQTRTYS